MIFNVIWTYVLVRGSWQQRHPCPTAMGPSYRSLFAILSPLGSSNEII